MLRWARGKTKKDHIKNEDIWREANIEPMTHKLHTTDMRMVRWARSKTKKDHIKNEDIWREANIEPMTHKLHTTEMRMLRWARGKTKKDHIKNEDIWREANIETMTTFHRQKRLRCHGIAGRGGYYQDDAKYAIGGKDKKGVAQQEMARRLWQNEHTTGLSLNILKHS